jgi:hypothetical protein
MKRQSYREYATEAFRFLGREGSKEKYIEKLIEDLRQSVKSANIGNPTEAALIHKEQALRDKAAELADLEAAEKVMFLSEKEVRQSVEMVYMKDCWAELEKGDIEMRVHAAEIYIPASRAAVYKWLARARRDFARERGLRL